MHSSSERVDYIRIERLGYWLRIYTSIKTGILLFSWPNKENMHRSSSSVTILLLMSTFFVVSCELSSKPLNQYAMLNDVKAKPMVLECHSTLRYRLTWLTKKPGSSSRCEIFNGYNLVEADQQVSSYCNVENGTPGKYILNVNATKESAQQYICLEPGSLIEASAEITIFESDPECNVTSYNESTIFTCHVHFRGNWSPVMEWRNGTSGEVINEGVSSVSVPNESLTSRLIVPSNTNLDSETYYRFITYFRIQDKPLETTANNTPSYFYNWTSQGHVTAHEHVGERTRWAVIAICLSLLVPMILFMIVTTVCWKQNIYDKGPRSQKQKYKKYTRRFNYKTSWIMYTIGHLTAVPRNTVVKLGDSVELECITNETIPVRWDFAFGGSQNKTLIYLSGVVTHSLKNKYAIDNRETGRYNLIMNSTDLSFDGTYMCSDAPSSQSDQQSTRLSGSAGLTVIVADPICKTNASAGVVEGSYIQIYCTVNYTGTWLPEIKCNKSNGQDIDTNTSYMYSNNRMPSFITQLNSDDNGVTFTCNMTFKPISRNNRTAEEVNQDNSVPDYYHFWKFTANVTEVTTVINQEKATVAADTPVVRGGSAQPSSEDLTAVIIGITAGSVMIFIIIGIVIFKTCKTGYTKPDIVPEANQNSSGSRSADTRPLPVYASVIKKTRDTNKHTLTNSSQENQNTPVYEEVKRIENDEKIHGPSGQIQLPTETEPQRHRNYFGADGTQYLELKSLTELKSNGVTERKPQMFNVVETYASIDHSMKAPPPPPQLPRRHCY